MSDQLSKVDLKLLQDVVSNILWPNGGTYAEEVQAIIDRIESAAAPVGVDEDWQLIDGHRSPDGMTYTATYWCANTGALKTETTSDGRFRAGEGPRIRRPTLARQLAEAKAEIAAHERNDLAETDLIHSFLQRLEQAESALAAATRRLGEVEGLPAAWVKGMGAEHRRICANQLRAALTKEPTK